MESFQIRIKTLPEKLGYRTLAHHLKHLAAKGSSVEPLFIYSEPLSVQLETGTIIGFETTEDTIPITFGYINGSELVIIQLLSNQYQILQDKIKEESPKLPNPYVSYNVRFVADILENLGIVTDIEHWLELQQPVPYLDQEGRWQTFDEALMKKEYFISSPLLDFGKGKEIPNLWQSFLSTTIYDEQCEILYTIIRHLRQSLLKELMLVTALDWPLGST